MSVHRGHAKPQGMIHVHQIPVRDWCTACRAYTEQWIARLDGPQCHHDQVCKRCTDVTYCGAKGIDPR